MIDSKRIASLRKEYSSEKLSKRSVDKNPLMQFTRWMNEAIEANISEANAMALATADKTGIPSIRIVLLKGVDENGFIFYTNYGSNKAKDLIENPNASILFFWKELERQVRISGKVIKTDEKDSETYFNSRPFDSRIGAWASKQSSAIANRQFLENKFEEYKNKFEGEIIPLPPFWGGFKVIPERFEFWQGRESRLHDRICYLKKDEVWEIVRLAP